MEKDLRDAYKALTLVRADLAATRRDKGELEERWRAFAMQQRHADAQRTAQVRALEEAARMREEDFCAQLQRLRGVHHGNATDKAWRDGKEVASASSEHTESDSERPEQPEVERDALLDGGGRGNQKDDAPSDNQKEGDAVDDADRRLTVREADALVQEKLGLLSTLFNLKTQLQEQADEMLEREATAAQERSEWMLRAEEMKHQVTQLQVTLLEVNNEKQFMEEKFEFLRTEVDVVRQERDELQACVREMKAASVTRGAVDEGAVVQDEEADGETGEQLLQIVQDENDDGRVQLEEQLAALRAKLDTSTTESVMQVSSLQHVNELLRRELDEKTEGLAALQLELEALRTPVPGSGVAEDAAIDGNVEDQDAKKSQLELRLQELQAEVDGVTFEAATWRKKSEALEQELNDKREQLESQKAEISSLAEQRDRVQLESLTMLAAQREKDTELTSLRARLETEEASVTQLRSECDHLSHRLVAEQESSKAQVELQLGERAKLQEELTTLLASIEAMTGEHGAKMTTLQQVNELLTRELEEATQLLQATRSQHDVVVLGERAHVRSLRDAVARQDAVLRDMRKELQHLRSLVQQEQHATKSQVHSALDAVSNLRAMSEETALAHAKALEKAKSELVAAQQSVVLSEVERVRVDGELARVQEAARVLREEAATAAETLATAEAARKRLLVRLDERATQCTALSSRLQAQEVSQAERVGSLDAEMQRLKLESQAHEHELQQLRLALALAQRERDDARDETRAARHQLDQLESAHKQADEQSLREIERLQRHVSSLEQQRMAEEDTGHGFSAAASSFAPSATATATVWSQLRAKIRALDDFLPQLQLFAGRLHTSLSLCEENAGAMPVLTSQVSSHEELTRDAVVLLELAEQWKRAFDARELTRHVRLFRRSVLATLSQWYECGVAPNRGEHEPLPPPAFGIDSHEVALILQNWTSNLAKQRRAARWLTRMATGSYFGDDDREDNSEDDEDAGSTLVLREMTRDVKEAFLVLVVPLLQQNRALFVRAFTRRLGDAKSSYSPDDACWEMRIHVQRNDPRRRAGVSQSNAITSARTSDAPSLRRASSSSSVSSVSSSTSATSSLSLSSISSASKLQIIQARLQRMQQQH